MKAVVFERYGSPDVLELKDVPTPGAGDNEVLIRIHAATVSTADCEIRGFTFPAWIWLPLRLMFGVFRPRTRILGQELAGEIEAVGKDVKRFGTGDRVFAPSERLGAHAEYICLPADGAMALKPDGMSYEEAACLTVFALNALHFIRKADIQRGEKILLNGAGGGIGTVAVQLAQEFGADVTAVDSAEKLDMLRSLGADHVIDFSTEDFTRNGKIYDVILDVFGGSPYSRSIRALSRRGRYVLANPRLWQMLRGVWTNRMSGRKVFFAFAGYRSQDLEFLRQLFEAGKLRPVIDRCYPMDRFAEAHRYVETGRKKGNVVLTL